MRPLHAHGSRTDFRLGQCSRMSPEEGAWIGRSYWGQGVATRALKEFLTRIETTRPLYARAASDNAGSIRVLEKCGFTRVGVDRGFAHGRNEETEEVILRLDA